MSRETQPADLDAEASLLGAILLRQTIIGELKASVDPADFYKPANQTVFNAMRAMHDAGEHIDAVLVASHLRREGLIDTIGGPTYLNELMNANPATSAYRRYSDVVIECSRRRKLIQRLTEIAEAAWQRNTDVDELIGQAAELKLDALITSRSGEVTDLYGLEEFAANTAQAAAADHPWLIKGLFKPRWRVILVASEGIGKAVLMRFLALHAAAGRDPWAPHVFVEPRRVLYVDTENPAETIMHQIEISNRAADQPVFAEAMENFFIWHREGGMDLRQRRTAAEFENVLQKTRPDIVFCGPAYKLFRRQKGEDMEQATLEFMETIDDLRVRYNFAIMIEHHSPKASGGAHRELNPFGSSAFLRWPEIGLTLDFIGTVGPTDKRYELEVGRFRRDRVENNWPDSLERNPNFSMAWAPRWNKKP